MRSICKIWTLIIISTFVYSCGGGGDDTIPEPKQVNNPPDKPLITTPTNNVLCINNVVDFKWEEASDPDGDTVKYQLQIATNNQFTENLYMSPDILTTSYQVTLYKGIAYYWKVKTIDSKGLSSEYSSIFQFYTEGDGGSNHIPFAPNVVAPTLHQIIQTNTIQLGWTASDVDNDPLTFDVYFGTANPPTTIIAENQSATTLDVTLTPSTTYYWKIIVKDGKGGKSIGQVWDFKTD